MPDPAPDRLRDLYGFDFPASFFRFREFLAWLPPGLLGDAAGMHPAYPFAAADGHPPDEHPADPLWEDRFYDDPPEFVTLFRGECDGLHWGYHFDDPGRLPPVVVSYYSRDAYDYNEDGDDLFEAARGHVEQSHADYLENQEEEPDDQEFYADKLAGLETVRAGLARFWPADRPEVGDEYLERYGFTARQPTAGTWDGMGIVVPAGLLRPLTADPFAPESGRRGPDPAGVGPAADEALRLTADGFPGAALKLGRELWVFPDHHETSYRLLDAAYAALDRQPLRRLLAAARGWRARCDAQRKPRG